VGLLIDSSIFIAAERQKLDFDRLLAEFGNEPAELSVVTAAELLHGVERADPNRRAQRQSAVEGIITRFPIRPVDLPVGRTYARLMAERGSQGRPIAPHDLMIAATAVTLGLRLLTRDARSFPTVTGLDVLLR
jgi:predicted nucleic acid-binding protein